MTKAKKTLAYEDLEKLKSVFKKMKNSKSKLGLALIDEALFCGATLRELKLKVTMEGTTTEMCQGDYSITRENPALRSYNTTVKNYQNLVKQISDLLNEIPPPEKKDELLEFLKWIT